MNCLVCHDKMTPYFTKDAPDGNVWQYLRCVHCGLVINKFTYDLTEEEWSKINYDEHHYYLGHDEVVHDPRWIDRLHAQAKVLAAFFDIGVFKHDMRIVDYGCGDGKLADYISDTGGYVSRSAEIRRVYAPRRSRRLSVI